MFAVSMSRLSLEPRETRSRLGCALETRSVRETWSALSILVTTFFWLDNVRLVALKSHWYRSVRNVHVDSCAPERTFQAVLDELCKRQMSAVISRASLMLSAPRKKRFPINAERDTVIEEAVRQESRTSRDAPVCVESQRDNAAFLEHKQVAGRVEDERPRAIQAIRDSVCRPSSCSLKWELGSDKCGETCARR